MRNTVALVLLTCAFVLFAQVALAAPLDPAIAPAVGSSVDFGSVGSSPLSWTVESVSSVGDSYSATLTRPFTSADHGARDPLEWATSTTGFAAYFSTAEYSALSKVNYEPIDAVPNFQRINIVGSDLVVTVSATTLSTWGSEGPHGNYSTTSSKCAVCHSVHQAAAPPAGENWVLLSSRPADSCTYCHIDVNSRSTMKVYDGLASNYNTIPVSNEPTTSAHRSMIVNGIEYGTSCAQCHTVHASSVNMTGNPYLDGSILRALRTSDPAYVAELAAESNPNVALSMWCLSCHSGIAQPHDTSHLIQASTTTTGTAQYPVDGCTSCHAAGTDSSAFPHYVEGSAKFLVSTPTTQPVPLDQAILAPRASQDGVCLRCHSM